LIYLSTNDLQCIFVAFGNKPCIFCGNNTNVLSCYWHVFINWNDLVEWYNGMYNVICTTCYIDICCAFKNAFLSFLMFSYTYVCSCFHLFNMIFIYWITNLSIFGSRLKQRGYKVAGQKGGPGLKFHARECQRVWGNEPSHSQMNSMLGVGVLMDFQIFKA
jgi:hypothetical protein